MNEIKYDFWDELFDQLKFKVIDRKSLANMIQKVQSLQSDVSQIGQKFEEIYNITAQTVIEQEEPKEDTLEDIQGITACTSTAIQTENDVKSEENSFFNHFKQSMENFSKEFEEMYLTEQNMADNMPSTVDEKNKSLQTTKFVQFKEVLCQDEIRKVFNQLADHGKYYFPVKLTEVNKIDYRVRRAVIEDYCSIRILLLHKLLDLEVKLLSTKYNREEIAIKMKKSVVANIEDKIDIEMSKLMKHNEYLRFIQSMHKEDIIRIFSQLELYCHTYNMPDEEVKIITHRDFIIQKIGEIKEALNLNEEVIDFNLQIERKDMETIDGETTNMSIIVKNNKYLLHIATKHQEELKKVYDELKEYLTVFTINITKCQEKTEETNKTKKMDKNKIELRSDNMSSRAFTATLIEEFIRIYKKLEMYRRRYDIPNKNVTIVMHPKPYNPTKMHDVENKLIKDNEYLAFVAMMHLEKIKELCAFFIMQFKRFNDRIEELTEAENFINQSTYVYKQISLLQNEISLLNKLFKDIEEIYKCKK